MVEHHHSMQLHTSTQPQSFRQVWDHRNACKEPDILRARDVAAIRAVAASLETLSLGVLDASSGPQGGSHLSQVLATPFPKLQRLEIRNKSCLGPSPFPAALSGLSQAHSELLQSGHSCRAN